MTAKTLKQEDLSQFIGTETWYRHWANRQFLYTEGVQHVAESGGAYWLIDEIVFAQRDPAVRAESFQCWELKVDLENSTGVLTCEDGDDTEVFRKNIAYTDFPLPEIQFYFTDNVLLLPSEY